MLLQDLFSLLPPLYIGMKVTLKIFVAASCLAMLLSFIAAITQVSNNWLVKILGRVYIEIFRGTSALVQLFWLYFVLPLMGFDLSAMSVGIVGLALNIGAYGAEVVRGAIQSLPAGQHEAGTALSMSSYTIYRRIVLPQALVRSIPALGNLLIELLKGTSLVSLITINDLTFQAQMLRAATLETAKIFALVLLIYFVLAQLIHFAIKSAEKFLSRGLVTGGL